VFRVKTSNWEVGLRFRSYFGPFVKLPSGQDENKKKALFLTYEQGKGQLTRCGSVLKPAVNFFSPLVQASAPRAVRSAIASATLGKPLIRECLFYP
jgi:hypothetical protein